MAYFKIRPEQTRLLLEVVGVHRSRWAKLYLWTLRYSKTANRLGGVERQAVVRWLEFIGRADLTERLNELLVVQFSQAQAARDIWGTSDREPVKDALRQLSDKGLLLLVSKGIKKHASVFVFPPLPEQETGGESHHAAPLNDEAIMGVSLCNKGGEVVEKGGCRVSPDQPAALPIHYLSIDNQEASPSVSTVSMLPPCPLCGGVLKPCESVPIVECTNCNFGCKAGSLK